MKFLFSRAAHRAASGINWLFRYAHSKLYSTRKDYISRVHGESWNCARARSKVRRARLDVSLHLGRLQAVSRTYRVTWQITGPLGALGQTVHAAAAYSFSAAAKRFADVIVEFANYICINSGLPRQFGLINVINGGALIQRFFAGYKHMPRRAVPGVPQFS